MHSKQSRQSKSPESEIFQKPRQCIPWCALRRVEGFRDLIWGYQRSAQTQGSAVKTNYVKTVHNERRAEVNKEAGTANAKHGIAELTLCACAQARSLAFSQSEADCNVLPL